MDSQTEEVEIKIEYVESGDNDPLSDKCIILEDYTGDRTATHQFECNTINRDCLSHKDILDEADKYIDTWFKCKDDRGRYLCRFCELTYSTVQSLRYHTSLKHSIEAEKLKAAVRNNKRRQKFKCHICKEMFKVVTDLKKHYVVSHKTANNFCHICRAVLNNDKTLSDHLLFQHNIILSQLYTCDTCGYRTGKGSHFKQHTNTHLKQETVKCSQCSYSTHYLPNLRTHQHSHNKNKFYGCQFKSCSYKGSTPAALKSHQLVHYREENFLYCDRCTYKTVYMQSLKKHVSSHDRNSIKKNYILNIN